MNQNRTHEEELEEYKRRIKEISNPAVRAATDRMLKVAMYQDSAADSMLELDAIINICTQPLLFAKNPVLPAPDPEDFNGDIYFGDVLVGDTKAGDCKLNVPEMIHLYLGGASKMGKSNLLQLLLSQLVGKMGIWIFDIQREMRHMNLPIIILDINQLRVNIFEPPSPKIDQLRWISKVCELFTLFGLYYPSVYYIKEAAISIYKEKGHLTIFDLAEFLVSMKERGQTRLGYNEASLNKLLNLTEELNGFLNCKKPFPLSQLASLPVCFEIDSLSRPVRRFVAGFFLLSEMERRKAENIRGNVSLNDPNSLAVVMDDGFEWFPPQLEYGEQAENIGPDFIQTLPLICRQHSIMLCLVSQLAVSRSYLANASTQVIGFTPDASQASYLADSLALEDPTVLNKLDIGHFIIRSGKKGPCLIRVPKMERRIVSDEEIAERMSSFVNFIQEQSVPLTRMEYEAEKTKRHLLTEDMKQMLINVALYPGLSISQRYKRLRLSGSYAQEVRNALEKAGYVVRVEEALESPRAAIWLVPTQKAIDYLRRLNEEYVRLWSHIGKTSPLHQLLQAMLMELLARSFHVKSDYPVGNNENQKFVDVYAVHKQNTDLRLAYEICLNPQIDLDRVKSVLEDGVTYYVFLCHDLILMQSIEQLLKPLDSNKIRVHLARYYISDLKSGKLDLLYYNQNNNSNSSEKQDSGSNLGKQQANGPNRSDSKD